MGFGEIRVGYQGERWIFNLDREGQGQLMNEWSNSNLSSRSRHRFPKVQWLISFFLKPQICTTFRFHWNQFFRSSSHFFLLFLLILKASNINFKCFQLLNLSLSLSTSCSRLFAYCFLFHLPFFYSFISLSYFLLLSFRSYPKFRSTKPTQTRDVCYTNQNHAIKRKTQKL